MRCRPIYFAAMFAALCTAMLPSPPATAQYSARATIPFDFSANHQTLPAGCYNVNLTSVSQSFLSLRNCDTGKTVAVLVRSYPAECRIAHSGLVFSARGRIHPLMNVRFANYSLQSDLAVQPKPERTVAKNAAPETIEIAMK